MEREPHPRCRQKGQRRRLRRHHGGHPRGTRAGRRDPAHNADGMTAPVPPPASRRVPGRRPGCPQARSAHPPIPRRYLPAPPAGARVGHAAELDRAEPGIATPHQHRLQPLGQRRAGDLRRGPRAVAPGPRRWRRRKAGRHRVGRAGRPRPRQPGGQHLRRRQRRLVAALPFQRGQHGGGGLVAADHTLLHEAVERRQQRLLRP